MFDDLSSFLKEIGAPSKEKIELFLIKNLLLHGSDRGIYFGAQFFISDNAGSI
eukprot:UN27340